MDTTHDLIVIGSGTVARVAATRCREAGWRVAVVDHRPLGGTCVLRGCDPKKVLISAAEARDGAHRLRGHGVQGEPQIDWSELMRWKQSFTDPVPAQQEKRYAEAGIEVVPGRARFTGRNTLAVGPRSLSGRHFVLGCGARPAPLGIPGAEHLIDSEAFLSLARLPGRLLLVGGGYIAAEFSHLAARAGAKVTVLQRGPRLLPAFDPDLVDWLGDKFTEVGIEVHCRNEVTGIETLPGGGYRVRASCDGRTLSYETDLVVHAAGRIPDLVDLDLGAAGIAVDKNKVVLNEFLQSTSNPAVYAAGDAAAIGPALTPVASRDAKVVAANLLEGNHEKPDHHGVPSVAFSLPPIARVGLTEAQARAQGRDFRVNTARTSGWYTNRRVGESVAGYKVLIDKGSDRILGAHLLGTGADEVINLFALAVRNDLPSRMLKETIFAYPTAASDIGYML